jgi:hypothetical protein
MWLRRITCLLSLLVCSSSAQQLQQSTSAHQSKPPAVTSKKIAASTHDAREQQALSLLHAVEASVGRFSPESQAKLLLQIGNAYSKVDRTLAVAALNKSFQATFGMQAASGEHERSELQSQIVRSLSRLQPDAIFPLRNSADRKARAFIEQQIVNSALEKGQVHDAAQMLSQWDTTMPFPYGVAAQAISRLPDKDSGERQAIFRTGILCFEQSKDGIAPEEIVEFIIRSADAKLPPSMLVDGMERVLAHVQEMKSWDDMQIALSGPKGSANFASLYDYVLFRFLPIFEQADPTKGETLRRDHAVVAEVNSRFPKGAESLQADKGQGAGPGLTTSFSLGNQPIENNGTQQIAQVESQATTDFPGAMALAERLSNVPSPRSAGTMEGTQRCDAYQAIAERMVSRNEFSHATEAIGVMLNSSTDLQPFGRVQYVISAVELASRMKDWQNVRQYIEKGMKLASELHQEDAFGQCPNEASKLDWPSTAAWRSFVVPAALLDVGKAIQRVEDISDPEIEASVQVAVASSLLNARLGGNVAASRCNESAFHTHLAIPWWENHQPKVAEMTLSNR